MVSDYPSLPSVLIASAQHWMKAGIVFSCIDPSVFHILQSFLDDFVSSSYVYMDTFSFNQN